MCCYPLRVTIVNRTNPLDRIMATKLSIQKFSSPANSSDQARIPTLSHSLPFPSFSVKLSETFFVVVLISISFDSYHIANRIFKYF